MQACVLRFAWVDGMAKGKTPKYLLRQQEIAERKLARAELKLARQREKDERARLRRREQLSKAAWEAEKTRLKAESKQKIRDSIAQARLARQQEKEKNAESRRERLRIEAEEVAERKRQRLAFKHEIGDYFSGNNVSLEAVGRKFGLSRERVRQILKDLGIDERNRWAKPRTENFEEIKDAAAADFNGGMTRAEVRAKYDLTEKDWKQLETNRKASYTGRFWAKVEKGEHWIYKVKGDTRFARQPNVIVNGRKLPCQHFVWIEANGREPKNWLVNTCGIKNCIKPEHWADLTPKEAAAIRKPRRKHLPQNVVKEIRESSLSRRELMDKFQITWNTVAIIQTGKYGNRTSNEKIREVLALKDKMPRNEIAKRTGLGITTVRLIVLGQLVDDEDRLS